MQKLFECLRYLVLEKIEGPLVIFIDEIDCTRSLPFDTDEFFAGIRECYNRRVHDSTYNRLAFCLLGVAVPTDLIKNSKTTPFNIGERVYLRDFTIEEALSLATGLPNDGESLVRRVHFWTNGHPFLTQSLCTAIANNQTIRSEKDVDDLVERELLNPKARETDINLADVSTRILTGNNDNEDPDKFRADVLSAYGKVLKGRESLADDESNRISAVLKLSGLMRSENKELKVRNRIYEKAFDKTWIEENMPGQELRRQRRAFALGVIRASLIAAAIVAVFAFMAIQNYRLRISAEKTAREKSYQAYTATMNVMPLVYEQGNTTRMRELLSRHASDPWKNIEWSFWDRMAHQPDAESEPTTPAYGFDFSPDGKTILCLVGGVVKYYDPRNLRLLKSINKNLLGYWAAKWTHDPTKLLIMNYAGGGSIIDASDGRTITEFHTDCTFLGYESSISNDSRYLLARSKANGELFAINATTAKLEPIGGNGWANYSDDNSLLMHYGFDKQPYIRILDGHTFAEKKKVALSDVLSWPIFSADAKHICGSVGKRLLWIDTNLEHPRYFSAYQGDIAGSILVGNRWFVAVTTYGHLMCVDINKGELKWDVKISEATGWDLSASKNGKIVTLTANNRQGMLLEITEKEPKILRTYPDAVHARVLPDGSGFVTQYGNLQLYRATTPNIVTSSPVPAPKNASGWRVRQVRGDWVIARSDKVADLYQIVDGKFVLRKTLPPYDMVTTCQSDFFGLARRGKQLVLRDFVNLEDRLTFTTESNQVVFDALGHDKVAIAVDRKTIELWDLIGKKLLATLTWPAKIERIQSSWHGDSFIVWDEKLMFGVVDVPGLKVRWRTTKQRPWGVPWDGTNVKYSKDDSLILITSNDDTADLWNARSGEHLQTFTGHGQSVLDGDISLDDHRVITTSNDQTLRVWDADTGQELSVFGQPGGAPSACFFSWDNKSIITIDTTQSLMKVWPVSPRSANSVSKA
jgi:WD40 repeat protein